MLHAFSFNPVLFLLLSSLDVHVDGLLNDRIAELVSFLDH